MKPCCWFLMELKLGLECMHMHVSCLLQGKPSDGKRYEWCENNSSVSQNWSFSTEIFLQDGKILHRVEAKCMWVHCCVLFGKRINTAFHLQIALLQEGRKNRARGSFGENCPCSTDANKSCVGLHHLTKMRYMLEKLHTCLLKEENLAFLGFGSYEEFS